MDSYFLENIKLVKITTWLNDRILNKEVNLFTWHHKGKWCKAENDWKEDSKDISVENLFFSYLTLLDTGHSSIKISSAAIVSGNIQNCSSMLRDRSLV